MRKRLGAFAGLLALVWIGVWAWARLPSFTPLTVEERGAALRLLRGALDGAVDPQAASLPGAAFAARFDEVVVATLFDAGEPAARAEGRGATLGQALVAAARALAAHSVDPTVRLRGRLKLDLVRGRAPMVTRVAPLFALSLVPGLDGVGLAYGGREILLFPDDLLRADLLAAHAPIPAADFDIGTDTAALVRHFAALLGSSAVQWRTTPKRFFRFGVESYIEPADPVERARDPARPVWRGNVVDARATEVTAESLRRAALAGGRYLLRHLRDDGHFTYEYYTLGDQRSWGGSGYSLPRHAGAAYYLAQLYGAAAEPQILDGARRALRYLFERAGGPCDRPERACVGEPDDDSVDLGSTAMALLAVAEFQRTTGDRSYEPWARRLANFLVFMQKPDGDFCHLYRPRDDQRDLDTKLLYYSGEAVYALAKLLQAGVDDPRYVEALDRGLGYLTGAAYDHFAGQFFYGEDHWTCLAADGGWDRLPDAHRRHYSRFCDGFAAFLRRQQFAPDDPIVAAQPDFLGAYGLSPLLPPHGTPVGSRSEALISVYAMDRRLGQADRPHARATRRQILDGMGFLLRHQITADSAYLMKAPEEAIGGFLMSDVKRYVRIDFIQHSCSAMLRAIDLL